MQTVLILEDEPDIRELIAITLTSSKVNCELCSHVSDALSVLKKTKPDFVLTDLKLPDGTGIELLKESRALYPDVAVAVVTAFADTDSAIDALRLGAVDYLKKPIDTGELRSLVKRHLSHQVSTLTARDPSPEDAIATHVEVNPIDADERSQILAALEKHRWNKRAAATALGLSYRQLRYRVSKLGLDQQ
ncbi:MAG: response regulator [Granulosicoccaceae bacterium]